MFFSTKIVVCSKNRVFYKTFTFFVQRHDLLIHWVLGVWVLGVGCWVLGVGCWVLSVGCWVLIVGCLGVGCLGVGCLGDGYLVFGC